MFLNTRPPGFSTEGYHVARCFSLVQLGTIFIVDKWQSQIRITWELPFDKRDYSKGFGLAPKQISKEYAASLYGKSWLKRHLIQWFGEEIIARLDKGFDPYLILGSCCYIKIEHRRSNSDKWFEEIVDIQPCEPENCPPQFNENRILTFENFDAELFNKLPDFVAQKIMRSKEYEQMAVKPSINPF